MVFGAFLVVFLVLLGADFLGALGFLGAFGFEFDFFPDDFEVLGFFYFDGVAFAGELDAAGAGASTFGASACGSALVFGVLGAFVVFGALGFVALVLGAFGLLDDLALDLLAFWDYNKWIIYCVSG